LVDGSGWAPHSPTPTAGSASVQGIERTKYEIEFKLLLNILTNRKVQEGCAVISVRVHILQALCVARLKKFPVFSTLHCRDVVAGRAHAF